MPCFISDIDKKFQSTHPRGVRRLVKCVKAMVIEFQSTHPRGVRHDHILRLHFVKAFQSTHPRGVRPPPLTPLLSHILFQSTHPRGVRLGGLFTSLIKKDYFNPRTREGCDSARNRRCPRHCSISIHAPARGATKTFDSSRVIHKISIHAPARGATDHILRLHFVKAFQSTHPRGVRQHSFFTSYYKPLHFNPRTREGCDVSPLRRPFGFSRISIHAPARGATQ